MMNSDVCLVSKVSGPLRQAWVPPRGAADAGGLQTVLPRLLLPIRLDSVATSASVHCP